jgi:hypothetical protein
LARVLALAPISELKPDVRTRRVHYDWLEAGEHTQRTVAQLSQQLRRFLDDQAWLENRRIMDILRGIESKSLALRDTPPVGNVMWIADTAADIELPLERPLRTPALKPCLTSRPIEGGTPDIDASAFYDQIVIDKAQLSRNVRQALQQQAQVTLSELVGRQPLRQGLAELVAYLQLGSESFRTVVDEAATKKTTAAASTTVPRLYWVGRTAPRSRRWKTKCASSSAASRKAPPRWQPCSPSGTNCANAWRPRGKLEEFADFRELAWTELVSHIVGRAMNTPG